MKRCLIPLLLTLVAPAVWAHDFWIEPSSFRVEPGEPIQINLRAGEHLVGEAIPRDPRSIARFVASQGDRVEDVHGLPYRDPAGLIVARNDEPIVVAYESRGHAVVHTRESFRRFLEEEHLVGTVEIATDEASRERFIRCAKSLISGVGGIRRDRIIGLHVELVAEQLPSDRTDELIVRLYEGGHPREGTFVTAVSFSDPSHPLLARTDSSGRVRFDLGQDGPWLVTGVVLRPGGTGVDYTSYWASLTFD